jgi:small subunit ribosomal protein S1
MRVTLSLKQLRDDPFPSSVEGLKPGDTVRGTVTSIVNFGAFVRLTSDVDALLHMSELPDAPGEGDAPTEFISRYVEVGVQVSARIVAIAVDRHRVSLTIRRPHPWLDNVGLPAPGDLVEGSVSKATKRGALVELASRVLGLVPVSQLDLAESAEDDIAKMVGEVLPPGVRVVAEEDRLDRDERVVILRRPSIIPAE